MSVVKIIYKRIASDMKSLSAQGDTSYDLHFCIQRDTIEQQTMYTAGGTE